jgi:hypothetical protein
VIELEHDSKKIKGTAMLEGIRGGQTLPMVVCQSQRHERQFASVSHAEAIATEKSSNIHHCHLLPPS